MAYSLKEDVIEKLMVLGSVLRFKVVCWRHYVKPKEGYNLGSQNLLKVLQRLHLFPWFHLASFSHVLLLKQSIGGFQWENSIKSLFQKKINQITKQFIFMLYTNIELKMVKVLYYIEIILNKKRDQVEKRTL